MIHSSDPSPSSQTMAMFKPSEQLPRPRWHRWHLLSTTMALDLDACAPCRARPCRLLSKLPIGDLAKHTLPIADCSAPDGSRRGIRDEWPRPPVLTFRPRRMGCTTAFAEVAERRSWGRSPNWKLPSIAWVGERGRLRFDFGRERAARSIILLLRWGVCFDCGWAMEASWQINPDNKHKMDKYPCIGFGL